MFCKNQPFKTLFRQIDDFLIRHAETALRITSTLKKWLSSDVAVILVNVIPSELDDKAREVAIKALDKAIQQLVFLDRLRSPDLTTEQKVLMAIDHLKTLPKAVQNTYLFKIASIIAKQLDKEQHESNVYDLTVQALYSLSKVKQ